MIELCQCENSKLNSSFKETDWIHRFSEEFRSLIECDWIIDDETDDGMMVRMRAYK